MSNIFNLITMMFKILDMKEPFKVRMISQKIYKKTEGCSFPFLNIPVVAQRKPYLPKNISLRKALSDEFITRWYLQL